MSAQKMGLQLDRLLQQGGALSEAILLQTNRTEDRKSYRASLRIGEGNACLLIGFFEITLRKQAGCVLQGRAGIGCLSCRRRQKHQQIKEQYAGTPAPVPLRAVSVTTQNHRWPPWLRTRMTRNRVSLLS